MRLSTLVKTEHRTVYPFLTELVTRLQPQTVLELGTGDGYSGEAIMKALGKDSTFTTVNFPNPPSGDNVGFRLLPWEDDPRLTQILCDVMEARPLVPSGVDLLFLDCATVHTADFTAAQWRLYKDCLIDGAIVLVDDIDILDMRLFWDSLPYKKAELSVHQAAGFGVFQYKSGKE